MISQWLSNPQSRVELWLVKGFCLLTCMSYYLHVLLVVSKVYVDLVFWWWVFDLEQTNIRSKKTKTKHQGHMSWGEVLPLTGNFPRFPGANPSTQWRTPSIVGTSTASCGNSTRWDSKIGKQCHTQGEPLRAIGINSNWNWVKCLSGDIDYNFLPESCWFLDHFCGLYSYTWLYSGLVQVDYEELMEGTFSPSVAEEIRKRGTLAAIFLLVRVSWICFWHIYYVMLLVEA